MGRSECIFGNAVHEFCAQFLAAMLCGYSGVFHTVSTAFHRSLICPGGSGGPLEALAVIALLCVNARGVLGALRGPGLALVPSPAPLFDEGISGRHVF